MALPPKKNLHDWQRCCLATPDLLDLLLCNLSPASQISLMSLLSPSALETLRALADQAPDLRSEGVLSAARIAQMQAQGGGWTLLYGMQRVDQTILNQFEAITRECRLLQQLLICSGGINTADPQQAPSKEGVALHTSCRQPYRDNAWPEHIQLSAQAKSEHATLLEESKQFLDSLNQSTTPYTDWIHVGIGGAELGIRALYEALRAEYALPQRRLHIVSSVESSMLKQALQCADLSRTMVAVHSQSGRTMETLHNAQALRAAFVEAGLRPEAHFISITQAGSPLDQPAQNRHIFSWPSAVQGRFSATSVSGALTLGFMFGWDRFTEILQGAAEMDRHAFTAPPLQNLPCLLAWLGVWNRSLLGLSTLAMIPYAQALSTLISHVQQLDMESNGKAVTSEGELQTLPTSPVIWGAPGTNAQHAFFQWLHQNRTEAACELIAAQAQQLPQSSQESAAQTKLLANMIAQSIALAKGKSDLPAAQCLWGNRPSAILLTKTLTPRTVGALLALYEHKITLQGLLWGLNVFDQPGVEYGKQIAQQIMSHLSPPPANAAGAIRDASPAAEIPLDPTTAALLQATGLI